MVGRIVITLACILILSSAHARMYQWQDPQSGTTHFSGKPPAWYRTGDGPRVIVFEKGYVVDDTRIRLSDELSADLRNKAIAKAEADREKSRQKALAAEELKASMAGDEPVPEAEPPPAEATPPGETEIAGSPPSPSPASSPDGLTEEEMRALILEWENQRTQQAREQLEGPDFRN